jgi:hypothetical protein
LRRFCFALRAGTVRFCAWPDLGVLLADLVVRDGFLALAFTVRLALTAALVDATFLAGAIDRRGEDAFFVRDALAGELVFVERAAFARATDTLAPFFAAGFFAARPAATLATCFTFRLAGFTRTGGGTASGRGASCAWLPGSSAEGTALTHTGILPFLHQIAKASESWNMAAYADSAKRLKARATTCFRGKTRSRCVTTSTLAPSEASSASRERFTPSPIAKWMTVRSPTSMACSAPPPFVILM